MIKRARVLAFLLVPPTKAVFRHYQDCRNLCILRAWSRITRDFACPRCQARYKIVRMRSEPGIVHQMLQCRVCEKQVASTENDHVLKYFLVSRPAEGFFFGLSADEWP
jgi:hypothetical protein